MMLVALLFLAVCFLAYANGANDNFKGVASLFGSRTCSYRTAVAWASVTTLAGSVTALFLAEALLRNFSGKGLVPEALVAAPQFVLAVAAGAGATVLLATRLGFPISTTHGLTGALVGAGAVAGASELNLSQLGGAFLLPLIVSPLLAVATGGVVYLVFRFMRGRVLGIAAAPLLDALHFLSAGAVCFARGLNDAPKIVALLLAASVLDVRFGFAATAVCMIAGGVLQARRVAETMSHKITGMNAGQGFAANLSTAALVTTASVHGLPVSTTHVSVGALLGMGIVSGQAHWRPVLGVLASWVITLPCAALLAGAAYAGATVAPPLAFGNEPVASPPTERVASAAHADDKEAERELIHAHRMRFLEHAARGESKPALEAADRLAEVGTEAAFDALFVAGVNAADTPALHWGVIDRLLRFPNALELCRRIVEASDTPNSDLRVYAIDTISRAGVWEETEISTEGDDRGNRVALAVRQWTREERIAPTASLEYPILCEAVSWPQTSTLVVVLGTKPEDPNASTTIQVLNSATPKAKPHEIPIYSGPFAVAPNGQEIATARGKDINIVASSATNANGTFLRGGHGNDITVLRWSPDGARIASGAADGSTLVWSRAQPKQKPLVLIPGGAEVLGLAWTPDGRRLAVATSDQVIQAWDLAPSAAPAWKLLHQQSAGILAWNYDGTRLASGSPDGWIGVFDMGQSQFPPRAVEGCKQIHSLEWSPLEDRLLAAGRGSHRIRIWDLRARNARESIIDAPGSLLASAHWWDGGARFASLGTGGELHTWDAQVLAREPKSVRCTRTLMLDAEEDQTRARLRRGMEIIAEFRLEPAQTIRGQIVAARSTKKWEIRLERPVEIPFERSNRDEPADEPPEIQIDLWGRRRIPDPTAIEILAKALSHKSEAVRWAAVLGLQDNPAPQSVSALIGFLKSTARPGSEALHFHAREALWASTNQSLDTVEDWQSWLAAHERGIEQFFSSPATSTRVLFERSEVRSIPAALILDRSGTMYYVIKDDIPGLRWHDGSDTAEVIRDPTEKITPENSKLAQFWTRLATARRLLMGVVRDFQSGTHFNVLTYSNDVEAVWPRAQPAGPTTRSQALDFLRAAHYGGETNTLLAIEHALKDDPKIRAIYLASDGLPSLDGVTLQPHDEVLDAIFALNRFRKLRIYTFGIQEHSMQGTRHNELTAANDFLQRLAEVWSGAFQELRYDAKLKVEDP